MIVWQLPAVLILLVPIVLVEVWLAIWLFRIAWRKSALGLAVANLASTVVGIPIAWLTMLGLELLTTGGRSHGLETPWAVFKSVVLQAAWLVPYEAHLHWMIPIASLVLLVPYFLVSVAVEWGVLRWFWRDVPRPTVRKAAWTLNGITYALLMVAVLLMLWWTPST